MREGFGIGEATRAEVAHTHRVGLHPDGLLQQANERLTNEVERLEAEVAQARAERDEARTSLDGWVKWASTSRCIYCGQEFTHDPHDQKAADEPKKAHILVCELHPLRQAHATIATLREQLQAAQELYEVGDTCVVCHAILEPKETEAPHCQDCAVTDEHEWARQDRIMQLEGKLYRQAHPTPAQEGR